MLIKIDFNSDIPIYVQLRDEIAKGIAIGEFKEGDNLPSVRQMGSDIGINMHTVNKAYSLLKDEGLISVDRRRGVKVNKIADKADEDYISQLQEAVKNQIAVAYCKGVKEEEYINICREAYKLYNMGGNTND